MMLSQPAYKLRLAAAIRFLAVATLAARLRGVGRINHVDRHACKSGLVLNILPEVVECPVTLLCLDR